MSFSILSWALSLVLPLVNGRLIDIITLGVDREALWNIIIVISILSLFNLGLSYFTSIIFHQIIAHIMQMINNKLINHIRQLSIKFSYNMNTVYLTQRIMTDANTISNFTLTSLKDFPLGIIAIIFNIMILISINLLMGLVLLTLIPIYILLFFSFRKKMYKKNLAYKEAESYYFEEMNSQIENIKFIKINALKNMFLNSFQENFSIFFEKLINYTKTSTLFSNLGSFITVCANIIILVFGVNEIFDGNLTIGQFTIILTYFNMVIGNIDYFLNFFKNYQTNLVSYNRLDDILKLETESIGKQLLKDIECIEFKEVYFSYNNTPLIQNFSFKFKKGKIYRIQGQNGSGKSTFMDLLLGLHEDYTGKIILNNIDLRDINLYRMRRELVAFVEQHLTIINTTMEQNIILDKHKDEVHERFAYLKNQLNLTTFLESNSSELMLSRKSNALSGGEKQKINILRNLLKESKLLMLDEATSALDINSEVALKEILYNEKKDRITILITHTDSFEDIIDVEINLS